MVFLHAQDTDSGQSITLRLNLSDARLMSAMLHIAVEGSEEVSEDTPALPSVV